ncbi:hypothetical protein [Hyphobacterium marinum]|uniref:Uncharacterized protein n=1 Tax=Hyphobacterium marinum TaxID=3116574 RepID=A0ABU7LW71_9PROT|nr:hypothetical protein [Hyphobacterium sp. Y6023]MEE2565806.1 hypothetical protein [Hyphobacterium sp. Y6023]
MLASMAMTGCEDRSVQTGPADLAARDWLETQVRVVGYWRDLLVESGGDGSLIAALDEHAAFLQAAVMGRV